MSIYVNGPYFTSIHGLAKSDFGRIDRTTIAHNRLVGRCKRPSEFFDKPLALEKAFEIV